MAGKKWSPEDEERLVVMLCDRLKTGEIAQEIGRSMNSVDNKIDALRTDQRFHKRIAAAMPRRHSSIGVFLPPQLQNDLIVFGDRFLTGDWHMDKHWIELVDRLFDEQKRMKRKGFKCGLCISGDLLNGDCYSSYPKNRNTSAAEAEFEAAETMLEKLLCAFDKIEICLGNHDARLIHQLGKSDSTGDLPHQRVARMFLPEISKGRIRVGNYFWMTLNDKWRLTHPKNYSRNSGITGKALATKFQQNISVAHEHHLGWCKDVSNRYQVINQGCMIDPKKADYIYERDSTSPEWNPGFVCVRDSIKCVDLFDGIDGYKVTVQ